MLDWDGINTVDVLAQAFDSQRSSHIIFLVSGDIGLAYTVSILQMRGHNVALLGTNLEGKSAMLTVQANAVFDWKAEVLDGLSESQSRSTRERPVTTSQLASGLDDSIEDNLTATAFPARGASQVNEKLLPPSPSANLLAIPSMQERTDIIDNGTRPRAQSEPPPLVSVPRESSPGTPHSIPLEIPPGSCGGRESDNPQAQGQELSTSGSAEGSTSSQAGEAAGQPSDSPKKLTITKNRPKILLEIPTAFRPLVRVLWTIKNETGDSTPLWDTVSPYIGEEFPWVYIRTGAKGFSKYVKLAEECGVVRTGEGDGTRRTRWVMCVIDEDEGEAWNWT